MFSSYENITNNTSGTFSTYGGSSGSYSGLTTYTTQRTTSVMLHCTFTAIAKRGKIVSFSAKGNNGACERYAYAL